MNRGPARRDLGEGGPRLDGDHGPEGRKRRKAPCGLEWQIGFWIGAFLLLILFLWVFSGVLLPFAAAVALGYLLNPVADELEALGLNRLGAVLLIMAGFVLLLGLIIVLIMPILWHQLASFIQALPAYVVKLEELITEQSERLGRDYGGAFMEKLGFGKDAATDCAIPQVSSSIRLRNGRGPS